MMDDTVKILKERMKDRHENIHTMCWSGEKTGRETEEKQNQWNLIRNNWQDQDWGFQMYIWMQYIMYWLWDNLHSSVLAGQK